jgi:hypothetical protein
MLPRGCPTPPSCRLSPPPQVLINGLSGPVTTFVVEPFVPHEDEYYLSIQSGR